MNPALIEREVQRSAKLRDNLRRRGTLSRNPFVAQGDPTGRDIGEGTATAAFAAGDTLTGNNLPEVGGVFRVNPFSRRTYATPQFGEGDAGTYAGEVGRLRDALETMKEDSPTGARVGESLAVLGGLGLLAGGKRAGEAIVDEGRERVRRGKWSKGLKNITNLIVDNKLVPETAQYRRGDLPADPFHRPKVENNAQSFQLATKRLAEGKSPKQVFAEVAAKFGTENQTTFVLNNIDTWFKGKEKAKLLKKLKGYGTGEGSEADIVEYLSGKKTPAALRGYDKFHNLDQRPVDITAGLTPQMRDDMLQYLRTGGKPTGKPPSGETAARQRLRAFDEADNAQVSMLLEGLNEQERAAALDGLAKRLLAAETRTRRNMPKGPDAGDWDDWVRRNTGPDRPGPVLPGGGSPEVLQDYTTPEAFANLLGGQKSWMRDKFLAKNPTGDLRGFDPSVSIAQNAVSGARQRALDLEQLSIDRASRLGRDLGDPVIGDAVLQAETQRSLDLFNQLGSPDTMAGFRTPRRLQGKSQAQRDVYEGRALDARQLLALLRALDNPTEAAQVLESIGADPVITNTARGFKNKRNREAWRRFVEDNE